MSPAYDVRDLSPCGPAPVELYDCGAGRFWARQGPTVRLIEADDAQLLQAIDGFRTIEEHVAALERRGFAELAPGDLAGRLLQMLRAGDLVRVEELVERLARDPRASRDAARIAWACWVTADRPALVRRSIQSWIAQSRGGEQPRVAVVDDSQGDETRAALAPLAGAEVWYAGRPEKSRFADLLAAAGIPVEVISFALSPRPELGTPYGAARNALLLATAGEAILSSHDDVLFDPAVLRGSTDGLAITSLLDPAGIRYFPDRDRLLEELQPGAGLTSLLAAHKTLLGRGVAECAREAGPSVSLADLHRDLALRLTSRPHRVLMTASGLYGGSGLRGTSLLSLRGESWERVTASAADYLAARGSREVVRCVSRATVADPGSPLGSHFGLDNRELLPPFFPTGRRDAGLFALALRTTHQDALIAHVPVAALHDAVPARGLTRREEPPPQPLFADVLSLVIGSCPPALTPQDAARRMEALAAHLTGMASLPAADLEKWVRERWAQQWASEMATCAQRVLRGPSGAPWVLDSAARLEQVRQHIEEGSAVWPRDLGGGDPVAAWQGAHDRLRSFGALLHWWPAIVAAARDLRRSGQGLLVPPKSP